MSEFGHYYVIEIFKNEYGGSESVLWGPFDSLEDSENFAESPDGPANRPGRAWHTVVPISPTTPFKEIQ